MATALKTPHRGAPQDGRVADRFIVYTATVSIVILAALIALETAPFLVGLFAVGVALGVALFHGAFGFTGGWRRFVVHRRAGALRAQLALLAVASVLIVPVLAISEGGLTGAVAPVGLSLLVGAALFGFGMQLGGGCGSGTLFTVGAGNLRMLLTLVWFIVGSVIGTLHLPWWLDQPGFDPVSLVAQFGVGGAVALQVAVCGLISWWVTRVERHHNGVVEAQVFFPTQRSLLSTLLKGPWPMAWAVAVLGIGSLLVLLLSGHTWSVTFAFALWGAKIAQGLGVEMSQFEFWTWDYPALALVDSVLVDVTSITNLGLLLGAMLAAGAAGMYGRGGPRRIPPRSLLAAVVGGLLMGYGARLAFGCNIGAMFSGIASASLHGWIWFVMAWLGSLLGIHVRPWFSLPND